MARRIASVLPILLLLLFVAAAPALAGTETRSSSKACIGKDYSYAGLQSGTQAHGVSATLIATAQPDVTNGHVGGWIGVGGQDSGPGGKAQWVQVGLAAMTADASHRMYYEVTVAGKSPHYHELSAKVQPGERHRFSVLEMAGKPSWWRVWVDSKPVSPPIHLPGSGGSWYPQAMAENWNGGTGTCNGFSYSFSKLSLAQHPGGDWRPLQLQSSSLFQDAGYRVVKTAGLASTFLATSIA
jgi:hypothetical protein